MAARQPKKNGPGCKPGTAKINDRPASQIMMTADHALGNPRGLPILPANVTTHATSGTALRLRAIGDRTRDLDLAALADEVAAIEDRLLYCEAAIHHLIDRFGIDADDLPDPLTVSVPTADAAGVVA